MLFIFSLVNFPTHQGQTSPPNPLDKASNPESPHSGFSGYGKLESSKVGRPGYILFYTYKYNQVLVKWWVRTWESYCYLSMWMCVKCDKYISELCCAQQTDTRRITHISAEQKRRFNIKLGFDTLHNLVTTLSSQPSIKVLWKRVLLHFRWICWKLEADCNM